MRRTGTRSGLWVWAVVGLLSQAGRARADLGKAEEDRLKKMGGVEWEATISMSQVDSVEGNGSWTFPKGPTSAGTERSSKVVKANVTFNAIAFGYIVLGVKQPDFSVNFGDPQMTVRATGSGSQSSEQHATGAMASGAGRVDWSSGGALRLAESTIGFGVSNTNHTWSLNATFTYDNRGRGEGGAIDDQVGGGFSIFNTDKGATLVKRGDGYVIDYKLDDKKVEHPVVPGANGAQVRTTIHQTTMHIELKPKVETKYVALIVPVKPADYPKWSPVGPTIPDSKPQPGQDLGFRVEVRTKKDGKLVTDKRVTHYQLDSSQAPGACMNFPPLPKSGKPDESADLVFEPAKNARGTQLGPQDLKFPDSVPVADQIATVTSTDYGAYGHLGADVTIGGEQVIATFTGTKGEPLTTAPVPQDDNKNHIADAWEKQTEIHVFTRDLAPTWDDEDVPAGMAVKGDGYDLYEEYRGFYLEDADLAGAGKKKWRRLDPNRRKLLVYPQGADVSVFKEGATRYGLITGITVFFEPSSAQLADLKLEGDQPQWPRWSNFNAHPDDQIDFGPKQAAVWILNREAPPARVNKDPNANESDADWGKTFTTDSPAKTPFLNPTIPDESYGAPIDILRVGIFHANVVALVEAFRFGMPPYKSMAKLDPKVEVARKELATGKSPVNIDWATFGPDVKNRRPTLIHQLIVFIVVHELGHATGARHHGLADYLSGPDTYVAMAATYGAGNAECPMRYWHYLDTKSVLLFLSGAWDMSTTGPYGAWKFCTPENWPTMRLKQGAGMRATARPREE